MNIALLNSFDAKVRIEIMSQRPGLGIKYETNSINLISSKCMVYENIKSCGDVMWLSGG